MELFIKVMKFFLYCIVSVITAVLMCGGAVVTIVGLYGMFDVLSTNYPDIYAFTIVILFGLIAFRLGWLFFDKIIVNKFSNKTFEG